MRCGIIFSRYRPRGDTFPKASAASKQTHSSGTWPLTIRILRIFILSALLFFVALSTYLARLRTTSWDKPLSVIVYPVNGDHSRVSANYIASLQDITFKPLEDFFAAEAKHYDVNLNSPVSIKLAPEVHEIPPRPPQNGNVFSTVWWSLKLRYWAYAVDTYEGPLADIRIFIVFFNPQRFERLSDSLGLQKGLLGVVYAFADSKLAAKDNVVIAHELLHTLGATDKYDPATKQPIYPDGFAEPEQWPRLPQEMAEIMGSRIPISETTTVMPGSLDDVIIGEKTAREIKWIE